MESPRSLFLFCTLSTLRQAVTLSKCWLIRRQYSFIHYGDLYSAPSRLLLRSAPDPCTAKEKSFEARVKCVRKNLGSNLCDKGSPFHTEGPTTENARAWVVEVRAKGTKSNPRSKERSSCHIGTLGKFFTRSCL